MIIILIIIIMIIIIMIIIIMSSPRPLQASLDILWTPNSCTTDPDSCSTGRYRNFSIENQMFLRDRILYYGGLGAVLQELVVRTTGMGGPHISTYASS